GDYWQGGFVIPKGGFGEIQARGLAQFHKDIVSFAGFLRDRVAELDEWTKIKLLTVQINRLRDWCREGLLCIGDSAHAMSPVGGTPTEMVPDSSTIARTFYRPWPPPRTFPQSNCRMREKLWQRMNPIETRGAFDRKNEN